MSDGLTSLEMVGANGRGAGQGGGVGWLQMVPQNNFGWDIFVGKGWFLPRKKPTQRTCLEYEDDNFSGPVVCKTLPRPGGTGFSPIGFEDCPTEIDFYILYFSSQISNYF